MDKTITNPQLFIDTVVSQLRKDFFEPRGLKLPKKLPIHYGTHEEFMPWYAATAAAMTADATTVSNRFSGEVEFILMTPRLLDPSWGEGEERSADRAGYHMAGVLAHELVHAALAKGRAGNIDDLLGIDSHDDPKFIDAVRALGLIGEPCCTRSGPKFMSWLDEKVRPLYEKELSNGRTAAAGVPEGREEGIAA